MHSFSHRDLGPPVRQASNYKIPIDTSCHTFIPEIWATQNFAYISTKVSIFKELFRDQLTLQTPYFFPNVWLTIKNDLVKKRQIAG